MSSDCPLARSDGLITEELDGELLLYDSESNLAHALDADAVALWRACDGHTDTKTLAVRCQASEEKIKMTLARLGELGLLEVAQADEDGDTRRSALRKIGIAGVGVATISSILVPTAAQAQSGACVQPGDCLSPGQTCCTGHAIPVQFGGCRPPSVTPPGRGSGLSQCCFEAGACFPPLVALTACCNGAALDFACGSFLGNPAARCL
jgi:hypothetical protein